MKKKNVLAAPALLALACALLATACPPEAKEVKHTDPAFLEGTWSNTEKGTSFTIASDLTFLCQLNITGLGAAQVSGSLDAASKGLGPNDYLIKGMQTTDEGGDFPGNTTLAYQLAAFQNLHATLTPNAAKTAFTFSSKDQAAQLFFAGTFAKQQPGQ